MFTWVFHSFTRPFVLYTSHQNLSIYKIKLIAHIISNQLLTKIPQLQWGKSVSRICCICSKVGTLGKHSSKYTTCTAFVVSTSELLVLMENNCIIQHKGYFAATVSKTHLPEKRRQWLINNSATITGEVLQSSKHIKFDWHVQPEIIAFVKMQLWWCPDVMKGCCKNIVIIFGGMSRPYQ